MTNEEAIKIITGVMNKYHIDTMINQRIDDALSAAIQALKNEPKRVGKLVRCKDCKWYKENEAYCVYWASIYVNADAAPRYTPFDYCFRGVRNEKEN